jgi:octopine oxidase subunit A
MIPGETDVVVIGAGPAGMAAATKLSSLGVAVTLLDENPAPGGQIYKAVDAVVRSRPEAARLLGADYTHGQTLTEELRRSSVEYRPKTTVWQVERDGTVAFTEANCAKIMKARFVVVATGAFERPVPVRGWTLPRVMTVGAAQLALKTGGIVPAGRVVLAGNGPLLLLAAGQLADAGADIAAVLETTQFSDYLRSAPFLPKAMFAPEYLVKGVKMRARLRRAGVPIISGMRAFEIVGSTSARAVTYTQGGRTATVAADLVLLHLGVVPNTQITWQAGCRHDWVPPQRHWRPVTDQWGRSSIASVFVAGDGAAIDGAYAAECKGRLCALEIACSLERLTERERDVAAKPIRRSYTHHASPRRMLDALFSPPQCIVAPDQSDILACRCEEITVGAIHDAVDLGCLGPNQVKSYVRSGMGPCQGRMCGLTIGEIIAARRNSPMSDVGYLRVRPPIKPLTVGELAALDCGADSNCSIGATDDCVD